MTETSTENGKKTFAKGCSNCLMYVATLIIAPIIVGITVLVVEYRSGLFVREPAPTAVPIVVATVPPVQLAPSSTSLPETQIAETEDFNLETEIIGVWYSTQSVKSFGFRYFDFRYEFNEDGTYSYQYTVAKPLSLVDSIRVQEGTYRVLNNETLEYTPKVLGVGNSTFLQPLTIIDNVLIIDSGAFPTDITGALEFTAVK